MKQRPAYICFIIVITGMVLASEVTGEREVIFPEIGAIALGCFLAPVIPWNTDYRHMFLCIALCAILGTGISMFVPFPLWAKLVVAYLAGQCIFVISGTTFAPMISAIVLPVLIGTEGIIYPIAAILLTASIITICIILTNAGMMDPLRFDRSVTTFREAGYVIIYRCIILSILASLFIQFDYRFCMAPPLLVAFAELCRKDHPAISRPVDIITMTTLMALIGAIFRMIITDRLAIPMTVTAFCISILLIVIAKLYKFYFPPSAAMAILAMLIPVDQLMTYPLQVLIGISIFVAAAAAYRRFGI